MANYFLVIFSQPWASLASNPPDSSTDPLTYLKTPSDGSHFNYIEVFEITSEVIKSANVTQDTGYDDSISILWHYVLSSHPFY